MIDADGVGGTGSGVSDLLQEVDDNNVVNTVKATILNECSLKKNFILLLLDLKV